MSFLNISDPKKRDAIVADYLATVKRIKNRNLQERAHDFVLHEAIENSAEPVVRSTKESTNAITKELLPIKEGIIELNHKLENLKKEDDQDQDQERDGGDDDTDQDEKGDDDDDEKINMFERITDEIPKTKLDPYFGIERTADGRYIMGKVVIEVNNNDIIYGGVTYPGTNGLWSLIMLRVPEDYTDEDFDLYRQLVEHTNVMENPHNLRRNSNVKGTYKWKKIFSKFHIGNTIQFLPSDIKGLQSKLNYLVGEYRAGNTSATRNQIVAIADELLRRKHLSLPVYRDINNFLQQ